MVKSKTITALGRDERTNRLIALLLAIGFLGLVGATGTAYWVQRTSRSNAQAVEHTLAVESSIHAFASANERAETARRGYLLLPANDFRARMEGAQRERDRLLDELQRVTADNDQQQQRVAELDRLVTELTILQNQSVTGIVGVREDLSQNFGVDRAVLLTRDIRNKAAEMLATEQTLLSARQAAQDSTISRFNVLLVLTTLLIVALSAATLTLIRRNLADLRVSRNQLNRMNSELEQLVDVRTEALRRANAEIQRFAYIVSHDLRSPLVNVMGFTAELDSARRTINDFIHRLDERDPSLVDKPTRLAVDEDLPESITFIRSSTQKMDRLINAILKLSREGRRTLTPEPVDLTALVNGIVASLQHRISETGTTVEVADLPEVMSDRLALEQILSNVVENALKYLRPGVPGLIRVTGREELGRAIIDVTDNGRGIHPRDHDRIFDLFRRSGTQDQPGEGIGLAHVRALAYRLGGLIEVSSELGAGSTFRLSVPLEWHPGDNNA